MVEQQTATLKVYVEPTCAFSPSPPRQGDIGMDLHADLSGLDYVDINWGEKPILISTGIRVEIPMGHEATIRPRSSLNAAGIYTGFGTIDQSYRGLLKVSLVAVTPAADGYRINHGDRIAQLVLSRYTVPRIEFVEQSALQTTARGEGGFGSTGR